MPGPLPMWQFMSQALRCPKGASTQSLSTPAAFGVSPTFANPTLHTYILPFTGSFLTLHGSPVALSAVFTLLSLALPLLGLPLPSPVHLPEFRQTLPSWPGQAPQHAALHHILCFSSMSPAKQLNPKAMCSACPLILMLWHLCQVPGTGLGWPVSMSFTLYPASQNPAPAPPSLIASSGPLSLT